MRARASPVRRRAIPAHGPAAGRLSRIRPGIVRSVNCSGLRLLSYTSSQDSGAAIQGPARGDVFFGNNAQAADWAGRMVGDGQAIVLVPNKG